MAKPVRISDDLYSEVQAWSDAEMRSLANGVEYLIRKSLSTDTREVINTPVGKAYVALREELPIPTEEVAASTGIELGCCLAKTPCKHWQYDDLNGTWTNTISGRIKEIE